MGMCILVWEIITPSIHIFQNNIDSEKKKKKEKEMI